MSSLHYKCTLSDLLQLQRRRQHDAALRLRRARRGRGALRRGELLGQPLILGALLFYAHLQALLAALSSHFESHDYLLGARTSLADCALMGPIYAHFYTDLGSRRLLLETALPVVRWIEFCNMPGAEDQGEWVDGESLSDSLYEVLAVMGRDAAPQPRPRSGTAVVVQAKEPTPCPRQVFLRTP